MAEPRTPPKEFLDWLRANYGWLQAQSWIMNNGAGGDSLKWQNDQHYQYWLNNVQGKAAQTQPQATPSQTGEIPPDVLRDLENYGYLDQIKGATTLDQLEAAIADAVEFGIMPEEYANTVYATYALSVAPVDYLREAGVSEENLNYLMNYGDKNDLAQRIKNMGFSESVNLDSLHSGILNQETPYTESLRGIRSQQQTDYQRQLAYQEQENQRQQQIAAPYRAESLSDVYNNPYVTREDMAKYRDLPVDQFTSVMRSIADERARASGGMTRAEGIMDRSKAGLGYRGESQAFLNAFNRPDARERPAEMKPMPDVNPIINQFIGGTGLGEGTRLRSYLESQIPETLSGVQGERMNWWKAMNVPEPTSYEDELNRLQSAVSRYGSLAASSPTQSVIGGTYFGPGGPAAIAQKALEYAQQNLANLNPEDYGTVEPIKQEEDPLKKSLANLKAGYTAKYYRQPGTGISSRLAPSVRFR